MRYKKENINITREIGDWEFTFIEKSAVSRCRFICIDKVSLEVLVAPIDGKDCNIIFRTSIDAEKYIKEKFPDREYDIVFVEDREFKDKCVIAAYKRRRK